MDRLLSKINLIGFTRRDAAYNMALDRHLLDLGEAAPGTGYLRFYGWSRPAISLGHSEPLENIDQAKLLEDGVELVRRPTGGRAVLHWDDLTYAVVLPADSGKDLSELYKLISWCIIDGARSMGLDLDLERGTVGKSGARQKPCFASVSRYEISYRGRKVVGSAQRIGERAMLQHGSIPVNRNYLRIVDYMKAGGAGSGEPGRERLRRELRASTACLEDAAGRPLDPLEIKAALAQGFSARLGCEVNEIDPAELEPGRPFPPPADRGVSRRKP
jgi:lipoate-protein ligase A